MEHTFTKVSLRTIKKGLVLGFVAPSLVVGTLVAKDEAQLESEILLKQAIVALAERNKALEARVKLLEDKVFPKREVSAANPLTLEELVKDNAKQGKLTLGKAKTGLVVRDAPTTKGNAVSTIAAGARITLKNVAYTSSGHLWYEIDDGFFVYGKNVGFWVNDAKGEALKSTSENNRSKE